MDPKLVSSRARAIITSHLTPDKVYHTHLKNSLIRNWLSAYHLAPALVPPGHESSCPPPPWLLLPTHTLLWLLPPNGHPSSGA